ncbi:MAG: hypothetical protein U0V74_16280 [Chitinophagales bacterium]
MNYKNDPLWKRIADYKLDDPEAQIPFSSKLAEEQQWTAEFTQSAIGEYKRFVYLCLVSPNGASPSPIIDEVWHKHLTYTHNYWQDFCKNVLRKDLHHHPSKGGGKEKDKHRKWFNQTLELYNQVFGEQPPDEIWLPHMNAAKKMETPKQGVEPVIQILVIIGVALIGWLITPFLVSLAVIPLLGFNLISSNNTAAKGQNGDGSTGSCSGIGCSSGCSSGDGGGDGGGCGSGCGGCGGGD